MEVKLVSQKKDGDWRHYDNRMDYVILDDVRFRLLRYRSA